MFGRISQTTGAALFHFRRAFLRASSSLLLIGSLIMPSQPARAEATLIVTSAASVIANDGLCALREAIIAANTDAACNGCPAGNGADTPRMNKRENILMAVAIHLVCPHCPFTYNSSA